MLFTIAFLATGGVGLVSAQASLHVAAIVPTRSGQIGVNPVSIYPPESYHVPHAHTQYWDQEPSTTKWIGVNTEYLTDLPYVTTIDNKPTVTTIPAQIAASLIASPTDGAAVGDIAITFSQKLSNVLNEIAAEVEAIPCGRRKRMACEARVSEFAHHVADELESGGRLAFVADNPTILVSAPDIAAVVGFVTNARARAIVSLAVTSYLISKVPAKLPSVFKLMKDMAITGEAGGDVQSCPPFELGCDGCKGNTLGICVFPWVGCPCKKTETCPDPIQKCDDAKCQGDSDNFCTNENKGCTCEPKNKCPEDVEDYPECNACGGNAGDFKCKDEYKGAKNCTCYDYSPVGVLPLRDNVDYTLAGSRLKDFEPHPILEDPANHECNGEGNYWTTTEKLTDFAKRFCNDNHSMGRRLRFRFPGKGVDDMSNAVSEIYDIDGVENTVVHIYAFVDSTSEDCKNRFPDGLDMDTDYCIGSLLYVIGQCPTEDNSKKFGGGANIRCQYYNVTTKKKVNDNGPAPPGNQAPSSCCVRGVDETCC